MADDSENHNDQTAPTVYPPGAHLVSSIGDIAHELHHENGREVEEGNTEYKLQLLDPPPKRFDELVSQMKWRLGEGNGEAIYEIGVHDSGALLGLTEKELEQSFETLTRMAKVLKAETTKIATTIGAKGCCLRVLVRELRNDDYIDVRIAVAGNVDSGKSTLIGVLSRGQLDDGRGAMRQTVFNHPHEIETGRTSSISHQIIGFDIHGGIVNYKNASVRPPSWSEIIDQSCKVVTVFDLAGHEKYLKTTVAGMTGQMPDYVLILVGANMGVQRMTKEHLGLALALKVPFALVVTKIDIAPPNVLENTLNDLKRIMHLRGVRRIIMQIRSEEDSVRAARAVAAGEAVVPMVLLSSVRGDGLPLLRHFLNLLTPRVRWHVAAAGPPEVTIDETYFVTGVGTVVGGTVLSGVVHNDAQMLLGPDGNGAFVPVRIKSIHCKRVPTKSVKAGQAAGFALHKVRRATIRKGMVLVPLDSNPIACWQFDAEIVVLFHSTTIRLNYQPVVQVLSVRQSAKIVAMDKDVLRTGDKALVRFRFMYRPEYMHTGVRLVLREGTTRGMGVVTKLYLGSRADIESNNLAAVSIVESPIGPPPATHAPAVVHPTSTSSSSSSSSTSTATTTETVVVSS